MRFALIFLYIVAYINIVTSSNYQILILQIHLSSSTQTSPPNSDLNLLLTNVIDHHAQQWTNSGQPISSPMVQSPVRTAPHIESSGRHLPHGEVLRAPRCQGGVCTCMRNQLPHVKWASSLPHPPILSFNSDGPWNERQVCTPAV